MNPVLLAPLTIGAISAILGALIAVTDKIVNNYGDLKLNINGGKKEVTVKGGSPLLLTLSEQGIFVPSACGGRGSCGACKVEVSSDVGPHLPTEIPYLTKSEMDKNVRLSCQVKMKTDLEIKIPEELFNVKRYKGVVERISNVTHDIKEVYIALKQPDEINFTAGQYAQIVIPPYGKLKETTQRAYSMSSHPGDKNHVELLIRLVPGGLVTTYVHNYVHQGQEIEVVGPFGDFMIQETENPMVFVAGGSGMAPFKSILNDLLEKAGTQRKIWYFFGARSKRDLFYSEEMKELEKKLPNFKYIEALSEPQPEDEWTGDTGLITDVMDRYFKEQIGPATGMEGYLCGSPGMINACIRVMTNNGIKQENIYFDSFA